MLAIFCAAQNFPDGRKDHERCQSVISVAIAMANVGRAVSSVGGLFSTLQERYSNASSVGPGLYFQPVTINKYILCLSCMEDWSKCQDNIETRHVSQTS